MAPKLKVAFTLGMMIAKHVHGVSRSGNQAQTNAIFDALGRVASGEITLLDTPEETISGRPPPPPELAAKAPEAIKKLLEQLASKIPEATRQGMRDQREVAAELLKIFISDGEWVG
jgi:hypothetical protein